MRKKNRSGNGNTAGYGCRKIYVKAFQVADTRAVVSELVS